METEKEYKVLAESILYNYFPKYQTLKAMTEEMFKHTKTDVVEIDTLNIYVDVYRMLLSLYHRSKDTVSIRFYTSIAVCIINFCAHIREFYKNNYGIRTRIFLVYNSYLDIKDGTKYAYQKSFLPEYNSDSEMRINSNTFIHSLILRNIPLIEMIVDYVDDIYFVSQPVESMITIYDLIKKNDNKKPNIIFTSCLLSIQLPAILDNTFIFRLYKSKDFIRDKVVYTDYFTVIHKSNAIQEFIVNRNMVFEIAKETSLLANDISSQLLSFIMALCGIPKREKNITRLMTTKTAIKMIHEAITANPLLNCYNSDINTLYGTMRLYSKSKAIDIDVLSNRFKAIDLLFGYSVYMATMPFHSNTSYMVNLRDPDGIKKINDTYFADNPLDLNRL